MAGFGLRAKLEAMNAGASAPATAHAQGGLRVVRGEGDAPLALHEAPSEQALRRMGVEFPWPGASRLLFLDTETTGLSGGTGTLAFMVGLGWIEGGRMVTEQYIMGDYPDELTMLRRVDERMRQFDALVTFNGRPFDLPMLEHRLTMMRLPPFPALHHIDLLPPARRLWKKRLGSVRLGVLEEKVLRQGRTDDLPGSEAPKRFFESLRTGNRELLDPVIEHNAQDVRSMAQLLMRILTAYAEPSHSQEPADLLSLGRVLERRDERTEALRCYHMASLPRPVTTVSALMGEAASREAQHALGMLRKRMGEHDRAVAAFESLARRGPMPVKSMIELAKLYEHQMRDYRAALAWTDEALSAQIDERTRAALIHRRARLTDKINRYGGRIKWD